MLDNVVKVLKQNYDFVYKNLKFPEKIIDKYFGIDFLNEDVSIINEEIYRKAFFGLNYDEVYELFRYDDFYDFINTYLKVDPDDILIHIDEKEFYVFVIHFIKVLNIAFKNWIASKSSGFRKNTKIMIKFIEGKGSVIIEYIPDLKL